MVSVIPTCRDKRLAIRQKLISAWCIWTGMTFPNYCGEKPGVWNCRLNVEGVVLLGTQEEGPHRMSATINGHHCHSRLRLIKDRYCVLKCILLLRCEGESARSSGACREGQAYSTLPANKSIKHKDVVTEDSCTFRWNQLPRRKTAAAPCPGVRHWRIAVKEIKLPVLHKKCERCNSAVGGEEGLVERIGWEKRWELDRVRNWWVRHQYNNHGLRDGKIHAPPQGAA